ncbi:hypothetical protein [Massilia yuzhufengensis]|uniref:Uncharacterized protein n=1 Tax=Massilia yuzhufengensis TaxID=1164594 RepID=A0A1I1W530_9BURK|nr:hypothetical protein [Massilia yuzhufengensis]SFD90109.1 hypothetical protein SAMN05216204_1453 [Massilia yuzhufengensis]
MPNMDIPPDEASSFTLARAQHTSVLADPAILGWLGRWVALALLLGCGLVAGNLLGPVLYRLTH